MHLVFPTLASLIVLSLLALTTSGHAGWWVCAGVLFAGFAAVQAYREESRPARTRVAVGSSLGGGSLWVAFLSIGESSIRPEIPAAGLMISLFLLRGPRKVVEPSPRSDQDPSGGRVNAS